jgi:hypothetical protein
MFTKLHPETNGDTMKIEKNVPIPDDVLRQSRTGQGSPWPFAKMDVGDYVFLEGERKRRDGKKTPVLTALHMHAYRNGKKFVSQEADGGLKVWRTE